MRSSLRTATRTWKWVCERTLIQVRQVFLRHVTEEVLPLLFEFYRMPQFNPRDPQSITTVNEIASLIHTLAKKDPTFRRSALELSHN